MYTYTLLAYGVLRSDGASIPPDSANSDYATYQKWLAAGNTPTPALMPTLAQAQAAQIAILSAACGAAVIAGLPSSALGAAYIYPTRQTDQTNLMAAVIRVGMPQTPANFMTPLALQTSPGVWGMLSHTVAQVQQVGQDIFGPISAMLVKNNSLAGQVMVASTVAAVQNINWS